MYLLDLAAGRGIAVVLALAITCGVAVWQSEAADHGRVVVTDTQTEILDVIEFTPGTAALVAGSRRTLDAVAETLRGNPSITLVEVQSHTWGGGDAAANRALSQQRAERIVGELVAAGVEPSRLTAQGYGDSQPLDRAAPAHNERISFLILQRTE
jgi:OmpA-OmpF porin, OOP family